MLTESDVEGSSVSDAGGDGSEVIITALVYLHILDSMLPEVRAHFSGGTGITLVCSGEISVTYEVVWLQHELILLEATTVTAGVLVQLLIFL